MSFKTVIIVKILVKSIENFFLHLLICQLVSRIEIIRGEEKIVTVGLKHVCSRARLRSFFRIKFSIVYSNQNSGDVRIDF